MVWPQVVSGIRPGLLNHSSGERIGIFDAWNSQGILHLTPEQTTDTTPHTLATRLRGQYEALRGAPRPQSDVKSEVHGVWDGSGVHPQFHSLYAMSNEALPRER